MVFLSINDYVESSYEEIDLVTMNDLNDLVGKMEEQGSDQAYSKIHEEIVSSYIYNSQSDGKLTKPHA